MNIPDFKTQKREDFVVRANIDATLSKLLSLASDIPVSQLIRTIFRSKGETDILGRHVDPFKWSDKKVLSELETTLKKFERQYKGNGVWIENDED